MYKTSDQSFIKKQDETEIVSYISQNPISRQMIFDFICENWSQLLEKYGTSAFTLSSFIDILFSKYNTKYELAKIEKFVNDNTNNLGVANTAFKEVRENIETNVRWMNKNFDYVSEWLLKRAAEQK